MQLLEVRILLKGNSKCSMHGFGISVTGTTFSAAASHGGLGFGLLLSVLNFITSYNHMCNYSKVEYNLVTALPAAMVTLNVKYKSIFSNKNLLAH